ncbi:MAG: Uma2 family endonuclease [Bernardetiaceae bacterium]|jgi:Uma2 family endonuclease|nr:Uma2 family endonuclease [Bernardetiaceae bacterium]
MLTDKEVIAQYQNENLSVDIPSRNHARIWSNLVIAFAKFRQQYTIYSQLSLNLGGKVTVPDVCLFATTSPDWAHDELEMTVPPLVVMEIQSPRQGTQELIEKFGDYFQAGVKSCWLINPFLRGVFVRYPDGSQAVFLDGLVKDASIGVEIPFAEIFA